MGIRQAEVRLHLFRRVHIEVEAHIVLVLVEVVDNTVLSLITDRRHIACRFATTAYIYIMSLLEGGLVNQVMPIGVRIVFRIGAIFVLLDFFRRIDRITSLIFQGGIPIFGYLG